MITSSKDFSAWKISGSILLTLFWSKQSAWSCLSLKGTGRDFPSGPVVKHPPCKAGDMVQFLVGELRSHMLQGN